jgi:S-adenosylmethionine:tRNA ribosyltransferase-isomerase
LVIATPAAADKRPFSPLFPLNQVRTADFDFDLPRDLIAQTPLARRDASTLLVLDRSSGQLAHRSFPDLKEYLRPGDVLVLNNSRVIPARLRGINAKTQGKFEVLLLEENAPNDWWAMLRPAKRAPVGTQILFSPSSSSSFSIRNLHATVTATNPEGHRRLRFEDVPNILTILDTFGEVPLPPYIHRTSPPGDLDRQRYQTVFAQPPGSVAAPTAGLHFTESLLNECRSMGVQICFVTLHVGLGTFAPVKTESLTAHTMHEEHFTVPEETARLINTAKREHRRIIAVGTTTLRTLESLCSSRGNEADVPPAALSRETSAESSPSPIRWERAGVSAPSPPISAGSGRTRIFIHPPYNFQIVDALLTNFHLPRSTLLMLVSAFAAPNDTKGRDLILSAYAEAIRLRYRFFSYGDAMLIL